MPEKALLWDATKTLLSISQAGIHLLEKSKAVHRNEETLSTHLSLQHKMLVIWFMLRVEATSASRIHLRDPEGVYDENPAPVDRIEAIERASKFKNYTSVVEASKRIIGADLSKRRLFVCKE